MENCAFALPPPHSFDSCNPQVWVSRPHVAAPRSSTSALFNLWGSEKLNKLHFSIFSLNDLFSSCCGFVWFSSRMFLPRFIKKTKQVWQKVDQRKLAGKKTGAGGVAERWGNTEVDPVKGTELNCGQWDWRWEVRFWERQLEHVASGSSVLFRSDQESGKLWWSSIRDRFERSALNQLYTENLRDEGVKQVDPSSLWRVSTQVRSSSSENENNRFYLSPFLNLSVSLLMLITSGGYFTELIVERFIVSVLSVLSHCEQHKHKSLKQQSQIKKGCFSGF